MCTGCTGWWEKGRWRPFLFEKIGRGVDRLAVDPSEGSFFWWRSSCDNLGMISSLELAPSQS